MRPIRDRILIKKIPNETVSPGGIILPVFKKSPLSKAEVISVGEKVTTAKAGDKILYPDQNGTNIEKDIYIISECDIRCIPD